MKPKKNSIENNPGFHAGIIDNKTSLFDLYGQIYRVFLLNPSCPFLELLLLFHRCAARHFKTKQARSATTLSHLLTFSTSIFYRLPGYVPLCVPLWLKTKALLALNRI
jgi:hypothetical protein